MGTTDLRLTKVSELTNGLYRIRVGKTGDEGVNWDAWKVQELHVQRFGGKVRIVSLGSGSGAEYVPQQFDTDHGVFEAEGHYMQIEGITQR
jgi:hypothetical protein